MDRAVLLIESRCHPLEMVLPLLPALFNQAMERGGFGRFRGLDPLVVVPAEAQIHAPDFTRTEGALEVQCCFASRLCRIDGVVLPLNQKAVKGIFHVGLL